MAAAVDDSTINIEVVIIIIIVIIKVAYNKPACQQTHCYADSSFLPQRWPKPSPVLVAPTHWGMARLSWPEWPGKYRNSRPAKCGPSMNRGLTVLEFLNVTDAVTTTVLHIMNNLGSRSFAIVSFVVNNQIHFQIRLWRGGRCLVTNYAATTSWGLQPAQFSITGWRWNTVLSPAPTRKLISTVDQIVRFE